MTAPSPSNDEPELRRDPIAGRWVILAPERGRRPARPKEAAPEPSREPCPFCPGNERMTPPEVMAVRAAGTSPNGPGWTTRVIPNKFAALTPGGRAEEVREEIYERMDGVGDHEVIVESPEHDKELSELPVERIAEVLAVARDRVRALCQEPRTRYALVFKNYGAWAGASQEHSHTQILSVPVIPSAAAEELAGARARFEASGRCAFCEIVEHEVREERRLVAVEDGYVALAPYAPRFAYETWILPRRHAASFESVGQDEIGPLAHLLRETLGRMARALDRPCYNFLIHSAPCREPSLPWYHWHVEIIPKLSLASGFEWGTGAYINPTPPEEAARRLREFERVAPS